MIHQPNTHPKVNFVKRFGVQTLSISKMEVALTSGSICDIIALAQIAIELGKALKDASNGAKQCQALRKDLDAFVQILMQVSFYHTLLHIVGFAISESPL